MTSHDTSALAVALTEAAKAINTTRTLEETLDTIVQAARASLPGFDHVGISEIYSDGRIETLAGTDQLVWELDDLQYSLEEGPCVDAIRHEPIVVVPHARHEQRWPHFIPAAVERGLQVAARDPALHHDEKRGGLNLLLHRVR